MEHLSHEDAAALLAWIDEELDRTRRDLAALDAARQRASVASRLAVTVDVAEKKIL